jgi:hypothetical protein
MKAKRQNRATSVSATMLDGTGGHVRLMLAGRQVNPSFFHTSLDDPIQKEFIK